MTGGRPSSSPSGGLAEASGCRPKSAQRRASRSSTLRARRAIPQHRGGCFDAASQIETARCRRGRDNPATDELRQHDSSARAAAFPWQAEDKRLVALRSRTNTPWLSSARSCFPIRIEKSLPATVALSWRGPRARTRSRSRRDLHPEKAERFPGGKPLRPVGNRGTKSAAKPRAAPGRRSSRGAGRWSGG